VGLPFLFLLSDTRWRYKSPFTGCFVSVAALSWLHLGHGAFFPDIRLGDIKYFAPTNFCTHGLRAGSVVSTRVRDVLGLSLGDAYIYCYRLVRASLVVALDRQARIA
jgi:hypothetical protein